MSSRLPLVAIEGLLRAKAIEFRTSRAKKCKMMYSFDKTPIDNVLSDHFVSSSPRNRSKFVLNLFESDQWWWYLPEEDQTFQANGRSFTRVLFFHALYLDQFINTFRSMYPFLNLPTTMMGLLRMAAVWDTDRPPVEELCIKMMFGATKECDHWHGEKERDAVATLVRNVARDPDVAALGLAYRAFLRAVYSLPLTISSVRTSRTVPSK